MGGVARLSLLLGLLGCVSPGLCGSADPTPTASASIAVSRLAEPTTASLDEMLAQHAELVATGQTMAESTLRLASKIGKLLQAQGRHQEQLIWDERSLRRAQQALGSAHELTQGLQLNLAQTYVDIGRPDQGERLARQVMLRAVSARGPDSALAQQAYATLANALTFLRRPQEALQFDRRALASRERTLPPGDPLIESAMNNLAGSLGNAGRLDESVALSRRVLASRRNRLGPNDHATLVAATGLAESLVLQRRLVEAEQLARQTLAVRQRYFGAHQQDSLYTQFVLANALHDQGRIDEALVQARAGAAAIDVRRAMPGLADADRRALMGIYAADMQAYAHWHGEAGARHWATGFDVAERAKARSLDDIVQRRDVRLRQRWPAELAQRVATLERRTAELDFEVARLSMGDQEQQQAATALLERRAVAESLQSILNESSSSEPGQVTRDMAPGQAYISWLLDPDGRLQAWVLRDRATPRFFSLGRHAGLASSANALRNSLLSQGRKTAQARLGAFWHARLLAPLLPHLRDVRHWIIAPDGPLGAVPLEWLIERAVGRHVEVSRVPSLAIWQALKQREQAHAALPQRKLLLALGDARYDDDAPASARGRRRGWYMAPTSAAEPSGSGDDQSDWLRLRWHRLTGSAREVQDVANLWRAQGQLSGPDDVQVLTGEQASKAKLLALDDSGELARYRYLHLAVHGYFARSVGLSALVFSRQPQPLDAVLTELEWPALHLNSDVAVLSACESGLGVSQPGEGLMGLPFALFAAGNVNTVVSLWPVDDDAAAAFVTGFFKLLAQGESVPRAVALAREGLRSQPRWQAPRYWAAWVLYGP